MCLFSFYRTFHPRVRMNRENATPVCLLYAWFETVVHVVSASAVAQHVVPEPVTSVNVQQTLTRSLTTCARKAKTVGLGMTTCARTWLCKNANHDFANRQCLAAHKAE